jgi:Sigma-54 interaction domain
MADPPISVSSDSRIAAARGGTLFLQDAAELPAGPQAHLARIARDSEVRIDGVPAPTAFRLVASASPGIGSDVHAHRLRADLYRRLATVRIDLPSLRDVPKTCRRSWCGSSETSARPAVSRRGRSRIAQRLTDEDIDGLFALARTDGLMPLVRRTAAFNRHRDFTPPS